MWTTFTNKVRKAFTDAADQYDILTSLYKEIGRELVKKTIKLDADRILDVGCGTGYVANKAKFFFPESHIIGLDLAEGMLAQAQLQHEGIPIGWLQADAACLPFKDKTFDLILSNFAYQWLPDLKQGFHEAKRILTPKGALYVTLFGFHTCQELFDSINACNPQAFSSDRLPTVEETQEALMQSGFKDAHVDYELIKVQFRDVWELLGWLKAIGANNLSQDVFLGKQMLSKVNDYYRGHFAYGDGICASFEIIWITARI